MRRTARYGRSIAARILMMVSAFAMASCAAAVNTARVADTPPVTDAAARYLTAGAASGFIVAWPGAASVQLKKAAATAPVTSVPTESVPRDLALFSGVGDETYLLWMGGQSALTRLYAARFDSALTLVRGPVEVSTRDTRTFAAAPLKSGDLLTLWTANVPGQPAQPLYLQLIDGAGRPHTAAQIADDAAFVAVSSDGAGRLHAAWLEPQIGGVYAIRYAQIKDAGLDSAVISAALVVGIVQLPADQIVERIRIGTTGQTVAIVWGSYAPTTERGTIRALLFEPQTALRESTREILLAEDARWPAMPAYQPVVQAGSTAAALPISLTQFVNGRGAFPALITLTNAGIASVVDFRTQAGSSPIIGGTAVDFGPVGRVSVAWAGFADGKAGVFAGQAAAR